MAMLLLGAIAQAVAQSPTITFIDPASGAGDVEIHPTITLRTTLRIDHSSVRAFRDTAVYTDTTRPAFLLVPKMLADSVPDSLLPLLAMRGTYAIAGDTIRFTPGANLLFNTTYTLKVHGVRAIDDSVVGPSPDTLDVTDASITFTTVPDVHHLVSVPVFMNPWIQCSDTMRLKFDRKLASSTSISGAIIAMDQLDSVVWDTDSTWHMTTSSVSGTAWLSASDSSLLLFKPAASLTPGTEYFVRANVSKLTGDSSDDRTFAVRVKNVYSVNVSAVAEDTSAGTPSASLLSHQGEIIAGEGSTVTVSALRQDANFAFVRWESPDDSLLDGSTDQTLSITQSCSALKDITLRGIFRKRDTVTVYVSAATHVGVTVYRYNTVGDTTDSIGAAGTYMLAPGEGITLMARPDYANGGSFQNWSSTGSEYNGVTTQRIAVRNDGRINTGPINIGPVQWPTIPTDYGLCVSSYWIDDPGLPPTAMDPSAVVTVNPSPCKTASGPGSSEVVTASVSSGCYEIAEIYIDGPGIFVDLKWPKGTGPSSWSSISALPLTKPYTHVLVAIRPKTYKLDLHTVLANVGNEGGTYRTKVGQGKDVRIGVYMVNTTTGAVVPRFFSSDGTYSGTDNTESSSNLNVQFMCGESLRLVGETQFTATGEEGYTFTHWDNTTGYQYPTPNTTNPFQYLVMDADKLVKGYFDDGFRLRQVGLYLDDKTSSSDITWFLPRQLQHKLQDDGNIFDTPSTGYGTKVRFKFNSPISTTTTEQKIVFTDLTERIDYDPNAHSYSTAHGGNVGYSSGNRVAELSLKDGAIGVPRAERYHAEIRAGIRNTGSELLKNPTTFDAETEMPSLTVKVVKITPLKTQGDGGIEMFTVVSGGIQDGSGSAVVTIPSHTQLPSTYCYDYRDVDNAAEYNSIAMTYPKMKKDWVATLGLATFDLDRDSDCEQDEDGNNYSAIGAIIGLTLGLMGGFTAFGGLMALLAALGVTGGSSIATALVEIGAVALTLGGGIAGFIAGLHVNDLVDSLAQAFRNLVGAGDPDPMGVAQYMLMWSNWFGAYGPNHGVHITQDPSGNTEWDVETTIK
ncbi:MAG TPA: Ig-like domain-containing protein [Candidatus Kapabacteria bacterium]|nr:Ig-like domain-containing protein [Candidatus Kapabacteria bacterium]